MYKVKRQTSATSFNMLRKAEAGTCPSYNKSRIFCLVAVVFLECGPPSLLLSDCHLWRISTLWWNLIAAWGRKWLPHQKQTNVPFCTGAFFFCILTQCCSIVSFSFYLSIIAPVSLTLCSSFHHWLPGCLHSRHKWLVGQLLLNRGLIRAL